MPIAAKQKGYFARSIGKTNASKVVFDLSCMMRCPTADNKRHQTEDCCSNVESRHCCHEGRCKCARILHAPQHYVADNGDTEQVGDNAYPLCRSADNLMDAVAKAQNRTRIRLYVVPADNGLPDRLDWHDDLMNHEYPVCKVILGESLLEPVVVDFNVIPHMLVGGGTGSGKTVLLRCILMQLLRKSGVERRDNIKAYTAFAVALLYLCDLNIQRSWWRLLTVARKLSRRRMAAVIFMTTIIAAHCILTEFSSQSMKWQKFLIKPVWIKQKRNRSHGLNAVCPPLLV